MKLQKSVVPPLSLILTCLYPCAFQYLQNAQEAHVLDMLPMLGLFLILGAALFLTGYLLLRRMDAAGLFSSIGMLFLTNCGLVGRLLKENLGWFRDRYVLLAVLVILVLLLILLFRKKQFPALECCGILAVLFASLTVIKLVPAVPTLWEILTFRPVQLDAETSFQGEKPNVYYVILDEYGGAENLSRYYDFDNQKFSSFLSSRDFNISQTSKNTESIWTSTLVPNLLNLGYVAEDRMPERVKLRFMDDPLMFRIFRNNGYTINLISHKDFIGHTGCNVLSDRQFPDRITDYLFVNSVFSQIPYLRDFLCRRLELQDFKSHNQHLSTLFNTLENCHLAVGSEPTLTVAYLQCPHYPFVFDQEGNPVQGGKNIQNQHFYLDQLTYLNTVLEQTVSNILDADPDSIIVLQSDHGTRYPGQMLLFYGEPDYDPYLETPYMQNALNCVYCQGKPLAIEGETGINTWRLILREIFGVDLPPLTPPEGYICYGRSWHDKPQQ